MANAFSNTAGNARNGQSTFTSTWITADYEYAILVRHDWHPIVCQRTRNPIGSWVTHDVYDTVPDNNSPKIVQLGCGVRGNTA